MHLYTTASKLIFDPAWRARRVTFFCSDFGFMEKVEVDSVRRINSRLTKTFPCKKFLACRCVLKEWRLETIPLTLVETVTIKKSVRVSGQ